MSIGGVAEVQNDQVIDDLIQVWTIGHSTRLIDDFIEALASENITSLVDVRSFPSSKRLPHFNQRELSEALAVAGLEYMHLPELGGRRPARKDSPNTAWQNPGLRGYADYMETEAFRAGIDRLLEVAASQRTAIMCAEAVWWRCHRSLISDYLKSKGVIVTHILSATKTEPHPYTSAARIVDGELSYRGLF
ncbi:MAG: DUF488 domain-containing protein [Acidobacteriota bacterium]